MATIKCYSGGKCVKTLKNIEQKDLEYSVLSKSSFRSGVAIGHGITITKKVTEKFKTKGIFGKDIISSDTNEYLVFDWRGDFSIEW